MAEKQDKDYLKKKNFGKVPKYVNKIKLVSDAYCQGYQEKCPSEAAVCGLTEPACVGGVCQAVPLP